MAATAEEMEELPVLLLLAPSFAPMLETLTKKYRLLKPYESDMPIDLYLATHAQSVTALLCTGLNPVTAPIIQAMPCLIFIVTTSVGVNHIDLAECSRRGITVTNSGTAFSADVADFTVGLLIDVFRRISASDRYVRRGLWPRLGEFSPLGSRLGGKRVGIVGLGNIGSEVAKRLEAFGCIISYHSRRMKPSVSYPYFSNICDLADKSDALIVACALTDETYHIINKDVLLALGKDGVIVNVGRGALVDEKELVRCLVQGEVGGAGLDVFENEPSVPEELFVMDNVVLSPHSAVLTPESLSAMIEVTIANLDAFFLNKTLASVVGE